MSALISDVVRAALGAGVEFHVVAWAYVSILAVLLGPLFAQVSPKFVDPPARLLVMRPEHVALWMPLSILATTLFVFFFFISIIGSPIAVTAPLMGLMLGYIATARILGERILLRLRGPGVDRPWLATLLGIVVFRLVRLVPIVGAFAHSLICWVGYAAVCAVAWSAALSWHRRRMPDARQFEGETLVEWYPDGDPADGKPAFGTGRPVLGNIRGEEDRQPPSDPT